ncbi:MAG: type IX secretion system membrane protein PorP/SprF [Bacteroidetes bacterium]|nr:type IX secretion system membrane protein PorP/SprF [Bacteroidota bacterium]
MKSSKTKKVDKINWMKIRILFIIIAIGIGNLLFSQQLPLITQYMFTAMSYNPGVTGTSEGINVTGLARQQWIGFKDQNGNSSAPQTFYIMIDAPLRFLHGGVGGSIMQDNIGSFSTVQVKLDYAYHMDLSAGMLGIGAEAVVENTKLDMSKWKNGIIDSGDPLLQALEKQTDLVVDLSVGGFYKVPDKYYIGISGLNLIQTHEKKVNFRLRRTFTLTGGYYWPIPNQPAFELQPSAILLFDGAALQGNVDAIVMYNKKIWGGLSYRYQDGVASIPVLVGMTLKSFKVGISYDIGTSGTGFNNNGSIEIMINYCFKIEAEKLRKTYKNTRFL